MREGVGNARNIAVQIMQRVFARNVRKCLRQWRTGVMLGNGGVDRAMAVFK